MYFLKFVFKLISLTIGIESLHSCQTIFAILKDESTKRNYISMRLPNLYLGMLFYTTKIMITNSGISKLQALRACESYVVKISL